MRIIIFDCEVFAHDWIFVFKELNGGFLCVSHNNNDEVEQFLALDGICLCGFNNKHYDNFILSAVVNGATPEQIKEINDYIIVEEKNGWEHPFIQQNRTFFDNFDLMDDTQQGTSLKSVEAHLGMSIEETEVDFNIARSLTPEELELTIRYCKFDVQATEKLLEVRKDYLQTKLNLGARAGIPAAKALNMTNAKITAAMLQAKRREWKDGRDFVYPPNLDLSLIPNEILDFFNTIHDKSIPDEVLFKTSIEVVIGGMKCKYAWGGAHGSVLCYYEEATENRIIQNRDVSSLYPSLIELYHYLSRNVPDPELFYAIRRERIEAKHNGNKRLAKDLKLPLNTVSGAQENAYNDLYDPLPTRSLRISGQLFITALTVKLLRECKTIKLLNLNTDGLAYSIDKSELPIADRICSEWEARTGFELETDDIARIWIKDVNNLLIVKTDGEVKTVGGYLNYGISTKGAWSINNNTTIVKDAVRKYFVDGTPLEKTISECTDIMQFQLIAKASGKYSETYQLINGEKVPVQRCNRVYATTDKHLGTLFKVHSETGVAAKISNLPIHCIVDNKNELSVDDIDLKWYIALAQKYVNDYIGVPRKKPDMRKLTTIKKKIIKLLEASEMATKTQAKTENTPAEITSLDVKSMGVWERLLLARLDFANGGVKKTGRHLKPNYMYFTLNDIVPSALPIFVKYRILVHTTFNANYAVGTVINIDEPEETIVFTSPLKEIEAIESNSTGGKLTNPMQDMGSVETYSRRYLYLVILDITEHDDIDGNTDEDGDENTINLTAAPRKAPATATERKEIVGELTSVDGAATPEQLEAVKIACARWRELDPSCEEAIQKIALNTDGFTASTKETCEALLINIGNAINLIENGTTDGGEADNV